MGHAEEPLIDAELAALLRESEEIAAAARWLEFRTRARIVRALPGVEADRARLLEVAARADALAEAVTRRRGPGGRGFPPRVPPGLGDGR